jgi:hypothetical protein
MIISYQNKRDNFYKHPQTIKYLLNQEEKLMKLYINLGMDERLFGDEVLKPVSLMFDKRPTEEKKADMELVEK